MKNISTILSVVALILIGVLFYRQSRHPREQKSNVTGDVKPPAAGNGFRIAYFDMDSLEAHYEYFKDARTQMKAKESDMNMELSSMDKKNQKQMEVWRQKGNAMTQAEGEQAQQEYAQMQQGFQARKQQLEQELYKSTEDLKTKIRSKIEDFLKDYNKERSYSMIIAYDPSSFIYYRDSVYNITPDLLEGLNSSYNKKK